MHKKHDAKNGGEIVCIFYTNLCVNGIISSTAKSIIP